MNQIQLTGALAAHTVLFICLCLGCVWQSYKCVHLYLLKETSVKMILMDATDERFPAISINPGFRQDELGRLWSVKYLNDINCLALLGLSQDAYLSGQGWTNGSIAADDLFRYFLRMQGAPQEVALSLSLTVCKNFLSVSLS